MEQTRSCWAGEWAHHTVAVPLIRDGGRVASTAIAAAPVSRDNKPPPQPVSQPKTDMLDNARFSGAYYSGYRKTGALALVRCQAGRVAVTQLGVEAESALDAARKPVLVGVSEDGRVILFDPVSKQIKLQPGFPADTFPAHIYAEPDSNRACFMNDGDKVTGNVTLICGGGGSSVTVIEDVDSFLG